MYGDVVEADGLPGVPYHVVVVDVAGALVVLWGDPKGREWVYGGVVVSEVVVVVVELLDVVLVLVLVEDVVELVTG